MNNIPYITCGYPTLTKTKTTILNHQDKDLMILSIPFSDPIAEDPKLQEACIQALQNGTTNDKIFELLEEVQNENNVPLILRTYANVIFSYGSDKFLSKCGNLNIKGIIVPDIPFEEKEEFQPYCDQYNVQFISTISTQSKQRIEKIVKEAQGLIYISARENEDLTNTINEIKKYTDIPYISDQDFIFE